MRVELISKLSDINKSDWNSITQRDFIPEFINYCPTKDLYISTNISNEHSGKALRNHRLMGILANQKDAYLNYICDMELFNAVTHIIGYQLGDRIYYGLIDGTLDKMEIRELFFDCFEEDGAALSTYLYFYARTKDIEIPERL